MTSVPTAIGNEVRQRAGGVCEYCRLPEGFDLTPNQIDHIRPRKHGGGDELTNLCWTCLTCNLHKASDIAGYDPANPEKMTRLFHPRRDRWQRHFRWAGAVLEGRTAVGRTTIGVLQINRPDRVRLRSALHAEDAMALD